MSNENNPNEVPEVPTTKEQQIIDKVKKGGRKSPHEELMGGTEKDNTDSNSDTNTNKDSVLNSLVDSRKSKEKTHTFKGFYLENEVAEGIDKITAGKGKGIKSDLANAIFKRYLKEEGIL